MPGSKTVPKARVLTIARKAGFPPEVVNRMAAELPDPVDTDRDGPILLGYGLTLGQLTDRMGGSP